MADVAAVPESWKREYEHVHGGVEVQALGETTKVFNGGDRSSVIGSIGTGWKP